MKESEDEYSEKHKIDIMYSGDPSPREILTLCLKFINEFVPVKFNGKNFDQLSSEE